ncbi:MAG TPA: ArsI/CadI family heavy metal resistance metalloenzyme [Acidimicrobiales bacterium]|nr:ArsI/CadI family heavy metal resistance metalloenzyme [Acidimicrobiales bacterium]
MSRVQLALNVSDLDAAVDFYATLFGVTPTKVRPGYANFAVPDPPLKLVLIESGADRGAGISGALNHVGIEVTTTEDVSRAAARLKAQGVVAAEEHGTTCCYAVQDKVWVTDPDQAPWEIYTVLADAPADVGPCADATSVCCQLQDAGTRLSSRSEVAPGR